MMLEKAKLLIGIGLIVAYTATVSFGTYKWVKAGYTEEKLALAEDYIKAQASNNELKAEISQEIQQGLQDYFTKAKPITKEIQRETITNHVYTDCRSTDGVVREYERKLDLQ